jgi:hypothetical protein
MKGLPSARFEPAMQADAPESESANGLLGNITMQDVSNLAGIKKPKRGKTRLPKPKATDEEMDNLTEGGE